MFRIMRRWSHSQSKKDDDETVITIRFKILWNTHTVNNSNQIFSFFGRFVKVSKYEPGAVCEPYSIEGVCEDPVEAVTQAAE